MAEIQIKFTVDDQFTPVVERLMELMQREALHIFYDEEGDELEFPIDNGSATLKIDGKEVDIDG